MAQRATKDLAVKMYHCSYNWIRAGTLCLNMEPIPVRSQNYVKHSLNNLNLSYNEVLVCMSLDTEQQLHTVYNQHKSGINKLILQLTEVKFIINS